MIEESENPMKMTMFRSLMLQIAVLVIVGTALGTLQVRAQDPSTPPPPPPPAQDGPGHGRGGPGGMRGNQVDFLTKKLNLTPDQVTQVKAIEDDSRKQMMALREDTSIAGADKRAKMMEIHKGAQDKIRALLTDDQKTKYDALQAEMRERMENRRGGPGAPQTPPPPPAPQQ
jgi:Spy/CpxP family protein refolding chaperone